MMIMIAMMMTLDFERCVSAPWPQAGQQTNWPRHHFHLGEPGRPSTYHHMKGELRDPTHHPKDDSFGITFTFLSVSHVLAFSPESELKDPPTIKNVRALASLAQKITFISNNFHFPMSSLSTQENQRGQAVITFWKCVTPSKRWHWANFLHRESQKDETHIII